MSDVGTAVENLALRIRMGAADVGERQARATLLASTANVLLGNFQRIFFFWKRLRYDCALHAKSFSRSKKGLRNRVRVCTIR